MLSENGLVTASRGLRGLKFGRCLAPEWRAWPHWKPAKRWRNRKS